MTTEKKYFFGPVPSRRLGLSLGVDIVPFKVCTIDCVYCQIGKTTEKTIERKEYVPCDAVFKELDEKLAKGITADYITISGSGEPTLNSQLGTIIDGIKERTKIPVAVMTNGTLFTEKSVREDCAKADLVLPSLDAGDEQTFQKINRPYPTLTFERIVAGLCQFRKEYTGQIWMEVFLLDGFNTDDDQIAQIRKNLQRIRPDKIQLNTAVRPTAESDIKPLPHEKLEQIAKTLGKNCRVVADFSKQINAKAKHAEPQQVLDMLKRRPCSLKDICAGLAIDPEQASKHLQHLKNQGVIESESKAKTLFFKAI